MAEGSPSPSPSASELVLGMAVTAGPDDREVVFTRIVAAPRPLVWRAWTEPDRLARWWGPHGFTCPRCELDLRPGGALRIDMRGPDGTDYPTSGTVLEAVAPARLVFTLDTAEHPPEWQRVWRQHRGGPADGPSLVVRVTATFDALGTSTRLTIVSRLASAADLAAYVSMGSPSGWAASLEKLEALLAAA